MQLEDWFDIVAPDDIRVKGTRVGIEVVLYDHIHRDRTAEEIAEAYPGLTLAQVYAVLLYHQVHQEEMNRYLAEWLASGLQAREQQRQEPHFLHLRARLQQARESRSGDAA